MDWFRGRFLAAVADHILISNPEILSGIRRMGVGRPIRCPAAYEEVKNPIFLCLHTVYALSCIGHSLP